MQEMRLPELGEDVTEAMVVRWLKQVGDTVTVDEPIVEVVTDKVNIDIPAEVNGTLREICAPEGKTVAVDDVLAYIDAGANER